MLAQLLLATSALGDSPAISSQREARGFASCKPEEAEFTVVVAYKVPGVVEDRDTYGFKRFWSKITRYADGSVTETATGSNWSGRCRDGVSGWCNGAANVQVKDTGPKVILDLDWGGRQAGHLKREFTLRWSELERTVKDKDVEIHVTVNYLKPEPAPDPTPGRCFPTAARPLRFGALAELGPPCVGVATCQ